MNCKWRIKFKNGEQVPTDESTTYLGVKISQEASSQSELMSRMRTCNATWRKLGIFWKCSACPLGVKLRIYDAIIRSKLVYGLESLHLSEGQRQKMNAFQAKGIRQIFERLDKEAARTLFRRHGVVLMAQRSTPPWQRMGAEAHGPSQGDDRRQIPSL